MADRCIPCERHAEMHQAEAGFLGNWLGIGEAANRPCAQCEQHAEMHASGLCLLVTLTAVAFVGSALRVGSRRWLHH